MGRTPCCDKSKVKKGSWSPEEDATLKNYLLKHGTPANWISLPHKAGLKRCGKSCRLRWLNYLRPDIKHGAFTQDEENTIFSLYSRIGSKWSTIASHLPGRTDNDVKNCWNTKLKKKFMSNTTATATATAASAAAASAMVGFLESRNSVTDFPLPFLSHENSTIDLIPAATTNISYDTQLMNFSSPRLGFGWSNSGSSVSDLTTPFWHTSQDSKIWRWDESYGINQVYEHFLWPQMEPVEADIDPDLFNINFLY